jgi:coproporphyrinogen III oxidase-like Fe-S oxidoreductase
MILKDHQPPAVMDVLTQFTLIEQAWDLIREKNFQRRGPWTFTCESDLYDSSRDELIDDYIGFGAAAFSTYGNWKIVNPPIDLYIQNIKEKSPQALIAPVRPFARSWRHFAHNLSDMRINPLGSYPRFLKFIIKLLKWTGYTKKGKLTPKGLLFSHYIMKSVVESLPFPLQNPSKIINYEEYRTALEKSSQHSEIALMNLLNQHT